METQPIRVMLVDDEVPILDDLRSFPYHRHGFQVVGTARNGEDALLLCEKKRPQVLITDLVMPIMDGIELSMKAREIIPDLQIIFISLYQDFDYAKKGIRLGVREYLIKGVYADQDLADALRRVRQELNTTANQLQPQLDPIGYLHFINGKTDNYQFLPPLVFPLQPIIGRFFWGMKTCVTIRSRLWPSVLAILRDEGLEAYTIGDNEILIHRDPRPGAVCRNILYKIMRRIEKSHHETRLAFTLAPGGISNDIFEYRKHVQSCRIAALSGFYLHRGRIAAVGSVHFRPLRPEEQSGLNHQVKRRLHDPDRLAEYLRSGFSRFAVKESILPGDIRNMVNGWKRNDIPLKTAWQEDTADDQFLNLPGLVDEFLEFITEHEFHPAAGGRIEIENVIAYIHENLEANIRLEDVAAVVGLSPKYLGHLFKKHAGEGFKSYLNRVRMERAAHYLRSTNMKVYEISDKIGIKNYRYFSGLFHRYYGHTPHEFRQVKDPSDRKSTTRGV